MALKSRVTSLIAPKKKIFIPHTRKELNKIIENPNFQEELKEKRKLEEEQRVKDLHYNFFSNDKNPRNHVKLFVNNRPLDMEHEDITSKVIEDPFIIRYKKPVENPFAEGTYGSIKGSVKRLKPLAHLLKGKHVYDAMEEMDQSDKKPSQKIYNALNMVMHHAIGKGFNKDHLWVKSVILERQWRNKDVYYHARGKSGEMNRDFSRIKIKLEEKPSSEIFKMFIGGDAPNGLAAKWRMFLLTSKADFEMIRKFQFVLTSKGRQQRRLMIRRKAQKLQDEFLAKEVIVDFGTVVDYIIEKEAQKFAEDYKPFSQRDSISYLDERKRRFKELEASNDK